MDITAQVQQFRPASREVWNHYFLATSSGAAGDAVKCAFDEVEDALYRCLISLDTAEQLLEMAADAVARCT